MKIKYSLLILMASSVAGVMTAQSYPDTVITVKRPQSVTVVKKDNGATSISIVGSKHNKNFRFDYNVDPDSASADNDIILLPFTSDDHRGSSKSKTVRRRMRYLRGVYAGAVFPQRGSDRLSTSWEIGANEVVGYSVRRGKSEFSVGLGFGYRRLAVSNGLVAEKIVDLMSLLPAPEGATDISCGIRTWAIHIPLLYTMKLHRSFGFSAGIVANFNFYTTATSHFTMAGNRVTSAIKGIHQRALTPDLLLTVGSVNNAGIYLRWSPVSLFRSSYGPEITQLSAGVSLAF